jgi:hypothetical protein
MSPNVHCRSLSRAHWYGELTSALGEAERLLLLLEADGSFPVGTGRLSLRVAAVRSEVEMLNRFIQTEDRIVGVPWSQPSWSARTSR